VTNRIYGKGRNRAPLLVPKRTQTKLMTIKLDRSAYYPDHHSCQYDPRAI